MTEKEINEFADGLEYTNGIYGFKQGVKLQKQKQDDFAIGFFEWCVSQEALDLINDLVLVGEINKATTSKELLEIYKKEKVL